MQRPNKKEQLEALRSIVGAHGMKEIAKAAKLTRELSKEFSHSQAQKKAQEVRELLSHYTPSKIGIVGGTAQNILSCMEETMQEANLGNGTWWID